ncbi:MAG: orotidine-5'-phosphate decarboxylase [Bacteroidia bacterium]|nr:orotidine-5'-phosphate decarboxylase [Bacteroidia bacterium]
MNRQQLISQISQKQSFLCTGLDTSTDKLPSHLQKSPSGIIEFNKAIINATADFSVAYKLNTAFYEQYGQKGWEDLSETLDAIPEDCFTIADAKRGDIGNTSSMYARAFFDKMNFDAVTVAPYMGEDSLRPFLEFKDKWIICLALTSNPGSADFQKLTLEDGRKMYEAVIESVCKWGNPDNLMFVVGATRAEDLSNIRKIVPEHFLLVPGVGAQGGSLEEVATYGKNKDCGLLINSSRAIIYASGGTDYAEKAGEEAKKVQTEMSAFLR